MNSGEYHIMPGPFGGWNIKYGETRQGVQHFITKQEAITWAKEISRTKGIDLIIHFRDGRSKKIHIAGKGDKFRA